MVAADHRLVDAGFQDRARPRADFQRPIAAAIGLDLRAGHRLDGVVDGRHGHERRRIERACDGIVRAGEIEPRGVAQDLHAHANRGGLSTRSVVVEEILAFVNAVGQAGDRLAHLRFGEIVEPVERGAQGRRAMLLAQPQQPSFGGAGRGHLGHQVALPFGGPAQVGQQEVALLLVDAVGGEEAQRRDAHALLPGLGRGGEIAAGPGASDVAPVGQADGEGEQTAFEEDRPDRLHVGQMVAADLGQVEEPDIARLQALGGDTFEELLHREAHDAEMDRDVAALGDQVALVVGEGRRQVTGLAQQRRASRAHDHERHLLGGGRQRMPDHLDGEGIDAVPHRASSRIQRWPIASELSV